MSKGWKLIFSLTWVIGTLLLYRLAINSVNAQLAGDNLARNLYYFLFSACAVIQMAFILLYHLKGHFWQYFIGSIWACFSYYVAHKYTMTALSDLFSYKNEVIIASFYIWLATLSALMMVGLLFQGKGKKMVQYSIAVSVLALVLFVFVGRGSAVHISLFVGGVLGKVTLENILLSNLLWFVIGAYVGCIAYILMSWLTKWIVSGNVDYSGWERAIKICTCFVLVALIPMISIPLGEHFNQQDIVEAKEFIDDKIAKIDAYYEANNEYPRRLSQVTDGTTGVPRILGIYDYLVGYEVGSFFLSRPEKYCFIFHDPGKSFGYFSKTSERGWRLSHEGESLEDKLLEVCDENATDYHQKLISEHLGLGSPDDPIGILGAEVGNILRPALSLEATGKLQRELDILGAGDSSVYGGKGAPADDLTKEDIKQFQFLLEQDL